MTEGRRPCSMERRPWWAEPGRLSRFPWLLDSLRIPAPDPVAPALHEALPRDHCARIGAAVANHNEVLPPHAWGHQQRSPRAVHHLHGPPSRPQGSHQRAQTFSPTKLHCPQVCVKCARHLLPACMRAVRCFKRCTAGSVVILKRQSGVRMLRSSTLFE